MSRSKQYTITCPGCGAQQEVELYEAINVSTDPALKLALLENRLNRVMCADCDADFRIDLPLVYNDPEHQMLIHWIPETTDRSWRRIVEEFDRTMEQINALLPTDVQAPTVRLVLTRVELVELLFLLEVGMNQRVVEYVKYSIHTRNPEKADPRMFRLLLSVQDSTDDELCFVLQNAETNELGTVLRYDRAAYQSMCELHDETPEEFFELFPGPLISARALLLEEADEA